MLFSLFLIAGLQCTVEIDSWESLFTYDGNGWGISVTASDVDEDGLIDLLFAGDYINIDYYRNTGDGFELQPPLQADGNVITVYTC